jgi:hypothetical protein
MAHVAYVAQYLCITREARMALPWRCCTPLRIASEPALASAVTRGPRASFNNDAAMSRAGFTLRERAST